MLIDSHCHLNLLKDVEIDNIIKQAIENNVQYLQTICTKLDDLPVILEIAEKYENVFASVGVHPCEVNSHCEALQVLKQSQEILIKTYAMFGSKYRKDGERSCCCI